MSYNLPTLYQQHIHQTKYARWNEEEGRRETWNESVGRYIDQIQRRATELGSPFLPLELDELRAAILLTGNMPSMRALMTAGPALERDHIAAFNCAYLAINRVEAFDEALFILCCGTGVGYSVESYEVKKLPEVPVKLNRVNETIVVGDSKEGWASAYRKLLYNLYQGRVLRYDMTNIRPEGTRLKTFGGRASGPGPLINLFDYTINVFYAAAGRKLTTIECHGLMCKVGDIVVSGGVRRSALICLSDLEDDAMRYAKSGEWWIENGHFRLANNSAVYTGRPEREVFDAEFDALIESNSGERGIVNREALQGKAARYGRRDPDYTFGTNPCGEIILRDRQFCNLTSVVARPTDSEEALLDKVRIATILGTIQASFTDYRYLSEAWKQNCEEEALLGVSISGVADHPLLNGRRGEQPLRLFLRKAREYAVRVNAEYAERWGMNPAAAITCNKPEGNSSQLVRSGSGINEWYDHFFIRRVRINKTDPVGQLLYMMGVPCEDDVMAPDVTQVFSWPQKAPEGALTRNEITALDKLKLWAVYSEEWCEHNPSTTVNVKAHEWDDVREWVYDNFDIVGGLSFLPYDDHVYQQAPYEAISAEEYDQLIDEVPATIDWSLLSVYEAEDQTTGVRELACVAGSCEV